MYRSLSPPKITRTQTGSSRVHQEGHKEVPGAKPGSGNLGPVSGVPKRAMDTNSAPSSKRMYGTTRPSTTSTPGSGKDAKATPSSLLQLLNGKKLLGEKTIV